MKTQGIFKAGLLAVLLLAGCSGGYSFTGASIPPGAKSIGISPFPNYASTVNPQLSQTLTDQLMQMFFLKPSHSLTKAEICEALWPKKPDASDTLYTLIRRLKPIVEQHSDLKIASDHRKSYHLTAKV